MPDARDVLTLPEYDMVKYSLKRSTRQRSVPVIWVSLKFKMLEREIGVADCSFLMFYASYSAKP